ncbi:MAG TPA: hypothetical protein VLC48_00545 [Gemmatimonadota bacterium]|nr:hypothetical protein [Gemmatimonadota bacterium]
MKPQPKILTATAAVIAVLVMAACQGDPMAPKTDGMEVVSASAAAAAACWGQATKVFAQMGEMGAHASQQPTPRLGLRNLARALYDQGVIADDSMEALGAFMAAALGLSIDACMK